LAPYHRHDLIRDFTRRMLIDHANTENASGSVLATNTADTTGNTSNHTHTYTNSLS